MVSENGSFDELNSENLSLNTTFLNDPGIRLYVSNYLLFGS